MEFYKTQLPFDQKELQILFAELDDQLNYIYYGRSNKSGLFQGIIPECEITKTITKNIDGVLHCSFIKVNPNCDLKAHTDTRGVAINYPIHVPSDSFNIQYSADAPGTKTIQQAYRGKQKTSTAQLFLRATEISRFWLDQPTVLDTHQPHGVSKSSKPRVVLSISMQPKYDKFTDVVSRLQKSGF